MNLNTGWKNVHIENNDEEEAQMDGFEKDEDNADGEENDDDEDYDEDKDEEENEPDFMDNSGKCWEFACKIGDEKHLKEWCQNKMGGMIVGKEEKLTRQFHCQFKECQFKAIFLKSCSTIYTRNKHNHEMKNTNNIQKKGRKETNLTSTTANERDYVDHYGKIFHFHAKVGKNVSLDIFRTKFGFTGIKKSLKTLNLYCKKRAANGGKCPIKGIYLKSNGFLYVRGNHEHTKNGKTPQNVGDDYLDIFGKIWKFNKEIGKNIEHQTLIIKFDFTTIKETQKTVKLKCQKTNLLVGGRCTFAGIYLKSNGCLYTRGEHEHITIRKMPQNADDSYVDHYGNVWPFHSKIGKKHIPNGIWLTKFGFTSIYQKQRTMNLYCQKGTANGGKCPIKGIYIKENGCLYILGKHEHK